jgi:hypothetical protein
MGGQIAVAILPFHGRLGTGAAVPTGFKLSCPAAALAGLHELVAHATVVAATFAGHKCAFFSLTDGFANHGYHPPFKMILDNKNGQIQPSPGHGIIDASAAV